MGRTVEALRDGWEFLLEREQALTPDQLPGQGWWPVCAPHDWSIEGGFDADAPSGGCGGYVRCGVGWYRRRLQRPSGAQRVRLEFDGVYQRCDVWLDGVHLARHDFGYMGFHIELTDHLHGQGGELVLRVDNSAQPGSRWYSGSGITRPARLLGLGDAHIAPWGVSITTPQVLEQHATVHARVALNAPQPAEVEFTATLDGRAVACCRAVAQQGCAQADLDVELPRLWSHESPALYALTARVWRGEELLDEVTTPFGIRTIAFDKDRGFLINGRRCKLRGACIHHDGGCVGAAVPPAVWRRRLHSLRAMGCNAIRMSHNPPDPALLDLCDEMGFYVMAEAFDEWRVIKPKYVQADRGYGEMWDRNHRRDLTDMLLRDRNHPSIVMWSIGNEIFEQNRPEGAAMAAELALLCHEMDPTRPVVSACDRIHEGPVPTTTAFMEQLDVVGANYIDRWRGHAETCYDDVRHAHPAWPLIGAEHSGIGGVRGDYCRAGDAEGWYDRRMIRVEALMRFTESRDYVAGDFMWTGIDYLGECAWPHKNASFGCLDTCGFPKDAYYFYQSVWTTEPMAHLMPHWNLDVPVGAIVPVLCYSNCDSVELFLNGKSYGVKSYQLPLQGMSRRWGHYEKELPAPTTMDLHLSWDVPYEPGVLKAVGRRAGETVCVEEVRTAGEAHALRLELDRTALPAGGIAHATVRVVDAQGRTVPTACHEVELVMEGPGRLLGMDNGRPDDHTPFGSARREVFNGLALAVIEAGQPGLLRITARSAGLEQAGAELTVNTVGEAGDQA